MSFTSTQLINTVALDLYVIGVGEAISAEDEDLLDRRCRALIADMQGRNILYLPNIEEIPDGLFEALVAALVLRLGPGYGRPMPGPLDTDAVEDRIKAASRPTAARRTLSLDPSMPGMRSGVRPNFTTGD